MKKLYLSLALFSTTFLYSMDDLVEVTLANNQKVFLRKTYLKRLAQCSTTLKNAAQDFNDEQLPTDFPFIEDPAALERMSNLLNDDGTPNRERCLAQTKGDWCTMAPALAALNIECLNPYLLGKLENAYSSSRFCKEILRNSSARSLSYETLPPTFKNELAQRINPKNVVAVTKYSLIKTLKNPKNKIWSVDISSDGQTLVAGCWDRTVKIWDLQSNSLPQTLEGHDNTVCKVAISPNSKTIVSGSCDGDLKAWDLQTLSLLQTLQGHDEGVKAVAITSDSKTLVSGGDKTIKLWNLPSGSLLKTLPGHNNCVSALAISPDDKILVSGSYDSTVKLWDLQTLSLLQTLRGHDNCVAGVAISPNGKILVSASGVDELKFWDLSTGSPLEILQDHKKVQSYSEEGALTDLTISADNKTLVSSSSKGTLKVWDLQSGSLSQVLPSHNDWVTGTAISRDGIIVSGSLDCTVKLWKLNLSPKLKKNLLQVPLEQALVIQALRTRPNKQKPFKLIGKSYEHFQQLRPPAQDFLNKELNIQQSFLKKLTKTLQRSLWF